MAPAPADWLVGGGEMAKVIKAKDWSTTPLGPIESWPQSLRTTVSLVQASLSPISLAWGPAHTQIYNDGYWPICGAKHPRSMGQDYRECWASAFPVIGEAYVSGWSGRSAYLEKMRMFLDRHGFLEETCFTFSFSPITDESGRVGGLFHPVTELTGQMLSERRIQTVRDLAMQAAPARTAAEALRLSADVLANASFDVPFAILYLVDEPARRAHRIALSGMSSGLAGAEQIDLDSRESPWCVAEAFRSGERIELDVSRRITEAVGPYPELPRYAMVQPIRLASHAAPVAVLVAGASARLAMNDAYRLFYDLVGGAVGTALTNAHALDVERRKAEALAELDRTKTAFFSNVSHEFRTPLTLMLGPLEEALARPAADLPASLREPLETMHRNGLRLLRLVNALLDFSAVEAGRLRASFAPADLAAETRQLAGAFGSAIEHAGLALEIDCPPLPEPVFVDHEMWEKIVLNLLSNALKYTQRGGITVTLHADGDRVVLRVTDTGIGIAADQLAQVFDRFHRVQGAWSRSHEGTGIGLALARELVHALGGEVEIASTVGAGTTVTVSLRTGNAHLPAEQLRETSAHTPSRARAAFVTEAQHWTPRAPMSPSAAAARSSDAPRILVADDNADMRALVIRLLGDEFDVIAVADGEQALDAVRAQVPELVLSDVMMPRLDGFGLVAALRADPQTQTVPVILLSARAGAEASTEGISAGADDYLIKPFAARELLARVRTHIALARTRRALSAELMQSNAALEAFSYSVSHDLRAPIRAIDHFAQILHDDEDTLDAGERRTLADRIRRGAQRMRGIIEDLLALAQVSNAEVTRERVDITAIAHRIVADLRRHDPGRVVEIQITDGLETSADGRLVTIALENLIRNAWKFTGKCARAAIAVDADSGAFTVRDNGAGFDMANATKLFEPFHRLHRSDEFEGTGIGLAIVRRIVERHGGQVSARGEVDHGATIRLTLEPPGADLRRR